MNTPELTLKERHRLLAQLANFIDDLPTDKLNMCVITGQDSTEHSCGSAGCAMGWSGTIHHRHGARLFGNRLRPMGMSYRAIVGSDVYQDHFGFAELYGISGAMNIVFPERYAEEFGTYRPTPRMVAKRIRDVLRPIDPEALIEVGDQCPERAEFATA